MIYFLTVNYYCSDLIANLVSSICRGGFERQTSVNAENQVQYKIIIINNSPEDRSIHHLEGENILILEAGTNLGFGKACNLGLNWINNQDNGAIVWIINPDACLLPEALEKVPEFFAAHPELSIVGTIIYTLNGQVWFAGGDFVPQTGAILSKTVYDEKSDLPYSESAWVSGCSLLVNLEKFQDCPQFDRDYFLYYEDFDFCRRYASQGHLIAIANQIGVVHEASAITGRNMAVKFKHSTYSYLLTIERYTSKIILFIRFTRLLFNALYLIPIKPQIAFGKLQGVWLYLRRVL